MQPLVSIIIANWHGCHHLEKCLRSLMAQTYPAIEVIVVDNGSTDGSAQWIAEQYPGVQLICNSQNLGFAVATNQGIRRGQGKYFALLNNDAWAEPDWLAELTRAIEADPRIGMVASKMVFANQPEMINSTGICVDQCGISWDRNSGQGVDQDQDEPREVFGSSAGAALYRRELFDEVGLFDEDFFAYLEDADLAWRARWCGWKAVYAPSAKVYHLHSATAREGSTFKSYFLARNKIQLIAKNYPLPHLWLFLPFVLFYEFGSLVYAFRNLQGLSALKGRLVGLASLRRTWKKRQALAAQSQVTNHQVFKLLEPVGWPWQVYQRYQHYQRRRLR